MTNQSYILLNAILVFSVICFGGGLAIEGFFVWEPLCKVRRDLGEMAFQVSRWVRRKWRQTWLKVWRTNGDWGSHG